MEKIETPKTAALYLRAPQNVDNESEALCAQAAALQNDCLKHNIKIAEVFYERRSESAQHQPCRTNLCKNIFNRKLKVDLLLFTQPEVFSETLSDGLHLHFILAKFGVTTQAILKPKIVFSFLPAHQLC